VGVLNALEKRGRRKDASKDDLSSRAMAGVVSRLWTPSRVVDGRSAVVARGGARGEGTPEPADTCHIDPKKLIFAFAVTHQAYLH
jgi:hypothetical protein